MSRDDRPKSRDFETKEWMFSVLSDAPTTLNASIYTHYAIVRNAHAIINGTDDNTTTCNL